MRGQCRHKVVDAVRQRALSRCQDSAPSPPPLLACRIATKWREMLALTECAAGSSTQAARDCSHDAPEPDAIARKQPQPGRCCTAARTSVSRPMLVSC
ncbi:hypothetical protein XFF6992_360114 [Xanthomonas citri pv. fuscans]|uniref:Uncharacterized protein n=1 Tax=Xanthomonas campestris pv. phaseoli TaxID=317013 RepID=A0A7Z7J555_XANCH|nr:hypothetical protein XFF6990_310026 [Xanthomonas citri pv. fuscans]SOO19662.1 hypothetical protein XFF6992_360114 [Xanthomonas citri pv. fuscans]SOO26086.1 hypothetical protein XFF6991_520060 [Xanthomonas phaseoli pv. phaseoli]SOO33639.1 hypothetical protein XFF6994_3020027 [Xanthomonas citri pv. fuscans]